MRTTLGIVAIVLFSLSILSALLGLGGIAAGVTGGGSVSGLVDIAFTVAKILFVLSLIGGLMMLACPR